MKVCDCVKDAVWYDPRVRKQIDEYIRRGHTVVALGVTDPRYDADEVEKMPCEVRLSHIDEAFYGKKRSIFSKIWRELKTNHDLYRLMRMSGADIIHANDLNALIPAYFAAKRLRCPVIYDTHEIFLENPWVARSRVSKLVWGAFERFLIGRVDLVVSVSHAAADYLKEKYGLKRIMVVTNCVSETQICAPREKARPLQVLNHGQFYEGRGYDILVAAAPLLADLADLQIVLRGFGSLEKKLRDAVRERGIENLRFAPPVKVYELIPRASEAWVGTAITEKISLNFRLSVSNKLFEYAAAGLPVILSDIPEHRLLNEQYHFGVLLEDDSPEAIARAVRKLHDDPVLYAACAENALRMSREINWEREFDRLLQYETDLVNNAK